MSTAHDWLELESYVVLPPNMREFTKEMTSHREDSHLSGLCLHVALRQDVEGAKQTAVVFRCIMVYYNVLYCTQIIYHVAYCMESNRICLNRHRYNWSKDIISKWTDDHRILTFYGHERMCILGSVKVATCEVSDTGYQLGNPFAGALSAHPETHTHIHGWNWKKNRWV